MLPDLFR